MKRVVWGIGAAAILFVAGSTLAQRREAADEREPLAPVYSTTFTLELRQEWKP